jgi:hypothetical protein
MNRATKLTCPSCGTALKSVRGVRIGKKITCPRCAVAFTVRPEDAERAARVDIGRLGIVLVCALLYLLGGAALALYCFSSNARTNATTQARTNSGNQEESEDDGSDTGPPAPLPIAAPSLGAVSAAEQRRIDDAIARGVWYLRDHMLPEGTWGHVLPAGQAPVKLGFASLPALTLLECGVPPNEPVIQKAAALVRQQVMQPNNVYDTYQRALALLFLDRLGDPRDEVLIQWLALCLIAGQHPTDGAWTYTCPMLDLKMVPELVKLLGDEKLSLDDWRKTALQGGTFVVPDWDNSNTQFAILALWVAQRHHVAIERPIALVEKHFRSTQLSKGNDPDGHNLDMDGSWYYDRHGPPGWRNSSSWPSMTCAGLLALAEAHGVTRDPKQKQQKPLEDPAIQRGLAMLTREIDRPDETNRSMDLYFLWSLERVGVLYNLPKIGGRDWYAWGRKVLLDRQENDGSWLEGGYYDNAPILNTCFALLFLKQANLVKDLTNKLQLLAANPTVQGQMPARKD